MRRRLLMKAAGAGIVLGGPLGLALPVQAAPLPPPDPLALGLPPGATLRPLRGGPDAALALMRAVQHWPQLTAWTGWGAVRLQLSGRPSGRERPSPRPSGDAEADAEAWRRHQRTLFRFFGGEVDLRPQFGHWQAIWSVEGTLPEGLGPGLLFLDGQGQPIHRVHLGAPGRPASAAVLRAHAAWLSAWGAHDMRVPAPAPPRPAGTAHPAPTRPTLDVAAYQQAWLELTDAHQFAQLLSETGLDREAALRLAPAGRAWQLPPEALPALYQGASAAGLPLLSFVHVTGLTHIHTGVLTLSQDGADAWQLSAPDMQLHLDRRQLARVWVAHRAGLHSVDCFDASGRLLLSLFAQRPAGGAQPTAWPALLDGLAKG